MAYLEHVFLTARWKDHTVISKQHHGQADPICTGLRVAHLTRKVEDMQQRRTMVHDVTKPLLVEGNYELKTKCFYITLPKMLPVNS